jgi:ankyrin repeat protein
MPILHRAIAVTNVGKTPLMDAVIEGKIDRVNTLISEGVNVDEQDELGWTALQLAAAYGRVEIVNTLLANGARPNIKNSVGRTALMYAAALGHTGIVRALLAAGADTNAASHDPKDTGEDSWTLEGETALMLAAWSGHDDIIKLLINAGADVNARGGPVGGTALHSALWEGFASSIQVLLESPNLDLSQTDSSGLTAKEAARKMGREEIALMLEEAESARMVKA